MRRSLLLASVLLACASMSFVACSSDDSNGATSTGGASNTGGSVSTGGAGGAAGVSGAAGSASGGSAGSLACDPAVYAAETLASGEKLFNGITLDKSTPMADVVANPADFEGKLIRIEGFVVEICQDQGCYVILQDLAGNQLNLKVTDGAIDFRDHAELGVYAIGEGISQQAGEHGAQIFIQNDGAMIGSAVCASFSAG